MNTLYLVYLKGLQCYVYFLKKLISKAPMVIDNLGKPIQNVLIWYKPKINKNESRRKPY